MFNFLDFFGTSAFATGTSLVNTYANLRAGQERTKAQLYEQRYMLQNQQENIRFDRQQLQERTAEYSAITNYQVDILRQEQLYKRQQLSYNILSSGIGITQTDSAGLLLRQQAYSDEMQARSTEAQMQAGRPRSGMNHKLAENNINHIRHNMGNIRSAEPWQQMGSIVGGLRDLASIHKD